HGRRRMVRSWDARPVTVAFHAGAVTPGRVLPLRECQKGATTGGRRRQARAGGRRWDGSREEDSSLPETRKQNATHSGEAVGAFFGTADARDHFCYRPGRRRGLSEIAAAEWIEHHVKRLGVVTQQGVCAGAA